MHRLIQSSAFLEREGVSEVFHPVVQVIYRRIIEESFMYFFQ